MTKYTFAIPASETVVGQKYAVCEGERPLWQRLQPHPDLEYYPFVNLVDWCVSCFAEDLVVYTDKNTDPSITTAGELEVGEWFECEHVPCKRIENVAHRMRDCHTKESVMFVYPNGDIDGLHSKCKVRRLPAPVWPEQ